MDVDRRSALRLAAAAALAATAAACDSSTASRTPAANPARAASSATPRTTPSGPPRSAVPARHRSVATEVGHGSRTSHEVALTFHGQGSPALATALLAEAERAGARVTVMAVGTWLDENPAMARRVLDGGHELGNHTMHHRPMARMDGASALQEISQAAAVLHRLTGSIGTWFRPSGTPHASRPVLVAAARAGYARVLSYDVDSLDYTDPGSAPVVRTTLAAVRPGSVISMHLGHPGTVAALPPILSALADRHLRPVTASQLLGAAA